MFKQPFLILTKMFSIIAISVCFSCQTNNKISLEYFFKTPQIISVQISPDGKNIVYGRSWNHSINIFVRDIQTNEDIQLTFSKNRDINNFFWSDNNTIIYLQDNDSDEKYHIFSVSKKGGNVLDLTPFNKVTCSILDKFEEIDNKILIQMNKRLENVFDVYRLDTNSAELELIAKNPGDVTEWLTDHNGKLRLCVFTHGINTGIRYRESEQDNWKTIATYNFKEMASPILFTFDNNQIYVSSNKGRDKQAIFSYDLKTGKEIDCIFEHPDVDVECLIVSTKRKKILGCSFITDKIDYKIIDERFEKMRKLINEKLPDFENHFISNDKAENKFIIYSTNDKTLGSYYLFDNVNLKLTKLFDISPWLKESDMSSMQPISYKSSDGLTINGYLTIPKGKEAKNLPLVVLPHGGPYQRDVHRFNPVVQFLSNRGYAVLQMNFRGSTGYGRKFLEAGYKQWGLKMQDDITAGVKWAIDKKIADPKKIAIFGFSYGGYATLCGIIKTPDLYAAAVDYCGVNNLFAFFEDPYWSSMIEKFQETIGDPERDKEQLIETSPCFNTDKIKTPLFIAQGSQDPKIKKSLTDQMVEELKKRGISVEYMVKDNEGHGFHNEENKFDFYRAIEKFFLKHLDEN